MVFCGECLSEYHNGSCNGPSGAGGATASANPTLPAAHVSKVNTYCNYLISA